MVVQLFAGMFLGVVLASLGWGFGLRNIKNKQENARLNRDELMHDIGELWVHIDSLVSSFRSGMMDERVFRNSFSEKVEEVNHILKPNLHLFEVFYVKYIEGMISEYSGTVQTSRLPGAIAAASDAESELETSFTAALPEQTDLFRSPVETELPQMFPVKQSDAAGSVAGNECRPVATVHGVITEDGPPVVVTDTTVAEPVDTVSLEALVDDKDASANEAVPEKKFDLLSGQNFPGSPELQDEEFTMETLVDVDLNTIVVHTRKEDPNEIKPIEEDLEKTRHFELITDSVDDMLTGKTEMEVVIASDVTHSESGLESGNEAAEEEKDTIPEETTYTRSEELVKKTTSNATAEGDEDFEVIIPDRSASEESKINIPETVNKVTTAAAFSEEVLTGDDVADKIAALELSSVQKVKDDVKEPAKEVKEPAEDKAKEVKEPVKDKAKEVKDPVKDKAKEVSKEPAKVKAKDKTKGNDTAAKPDVDAKESGKNATKKKEPNLKEREESITGNDVADQIDSFFGLFK